MAIAKHFELKLPTCTDSCCERFLATFSVATCCMH